MVDAELIAYVNGPTKEKIGGFLGFGGNNVVRYYISPQIYIDQDENPTGSLELFHIDFDEVQTQESLERLIKLQIDEKLRIGATFNAKGSILPKENINVVVNFEEITD